MNTTLPGPCTVAHQISSDAERIRIAGLVHEIMHAIHAAEALAAVLDLMAAGLTEDVIAAARALSKLATLKPTELAAEILTALLYGRDISPELRRAHLALRGPAPAAPSEAPGTIVFTGQAGDGITRTAQQVANQVALAWVRKEVTHREPEQTLAAMDLVTRVELPRVSSAATPAVATRLLDAAATR